MEKIEYRDAKISEVVDISKLFISMWEESRSKVKLKEAAIDKVIIEYMTSILKDNFYLKVAIKDNKIIGFLSGNIYFNDRWDKWMGYCSEIFMIKEFRSMNMGSYMIEDLKNWFKGNGINQAMFDVPGDHIDKWLRRTGYEHYTSTISLDLVLDEENKKGDKL
jgi:hypothetical protein